MGTCIRHGKTYFTDRHSSVSQDDGIAGAPRLVNHDVAYHDLYCATDLDELS